MPRFNVEVSVSYRFQFDGPEHSIEADSEDAACQIASDRALQLFNAQYGVPVRRENAPIKEPAKLKIESCEQLPD